MRKQYKAYLHSNKASAYEYNDTQGLGLDTASDAFTKFMYSLYEVEFDMELDTETAETYIVAVNGVKLEHPVKG